jgi:hypothetical protein
MRNDSHINDFSSPTTLGKALVFYLKFSFCNKLSPLHAIPSGHTGLLHVFLGSLCRVDTGILERNSPANKGMFAGLF